MGRDSKKSKKEVVVEEDEIESDFEIDSDDMDNGMLTSVGEDGVDDEDSIDSSDDGEEEEEEEEEEVEGSDINDSDEESEVEEEVYGKQGQKDDDFYDGMDSDDNEEVGRLNAESKGAALEELEKEIMEIRNEEEDILRNLKRYKDEDVLKGQAVKNQKALWDRALECRFLLQKAFSTSNRLPQDPTRSLFCSSSDDISEAYSRLITSSKKTLDSILELQEALLEKNPAIDQSASVNSTKPAMHAETKTNEEADDEEWATISQMQSRMASFRDKSIDKWHRKTQVTSGAAAIKGKLEAFNQNISGQVASYMRDPSKMIKGMQQNRSVIALFGTVPDSSGNQNQETIKSDGDPELLDDSEFYQQLLKEFLESVDPSSSETAFYALKRLQTKKRKIVDRRASKCRKIRYHEHEKIKNFMAPEPMALPDMAPRLFSNLFGLKTQGSATRA